MALALLLPACAPARIPVGTDTPTPPTAAPTPSPTPAAGETSTPGGPLTFRLVGGQTFARFIVHEVLRGNPNRVVGESGSVSGEIVVDPAHPDRAAVGPILVDAASFVTDSELRDSSLRAFILEADRFPGIVFTGTALEGIPHSLAVGDSPAFDLIGDLTIRDVTRLVTFEVRLRIESADRVSGEAEAVVRRSDFGLTIPSVPDVAEVAEQVTLRLVFVAERVP